MRKGYRKMLAITMMLATIFTMPAYAEETASRFGSMKDDDGGRMIDTNNLTWQTKAGEVTVIGNGPKYSDLHPSVTDRESILREKVNYNIIQPGEINPAWNSVGEQKLSMYDAEELRLLQEFVNSFDWINADELTRANAVWNRIANGVYGNTYDTPQGGVYSMFPLLKYKTGVCDEFAGEFQRLATYVGLECVKYSPAVRHAAVMIKINGQWLTADPTKGGRLYSFMCPVDYEKEYNRSSKEYRETDEYKSFQEELEWQRQAESGEITWVEYYKKIYPEMTEQEIQDKFFSWDGNF